MWSAAATAATDFITKNNSQSNKYRLYAETGDKTKDYYQCFISTPWLNNEYILSRSAWTTNALEIFLSPCGFSGSTNSVGRTNPTQNLVDAYEMANGLPIDDPNSGYDENDPYKNRDPRFEQTFLHHGSTWGDPNQSEERMIDISYPDGMDYQELHGGTTTGYYSKKFLNNMSFKSPTSYTRACPIFRYAEILLNAAEAINEASGPNDAYQYVNEVRARAGMPAYSGMTKEQLRERIRNERRTNTTFTANMAAYKDEAAIHVNTELVNLRDLILTRTIDARPFVPKGETLNQRCEEIFEIQVMGLAKRLIHTNCKTVVVGISGGLDSTLALLVCVKTFDKLGLPRKGIVGITMPGFGTTDRTYNNALHLMSSLGITIHEISIKEACIQHFKDIDHDMTKHDVTYENGQARERTQILMDYANKVNAMVIGTGDLSELALGWATYNGDHMSMYGVNASIPKTLVKHLVSWVALNGVDYESRNTLLDIVDTPISPELIPADEQGNIKQKTEDLVGPYELHDFFIYHFMRFGFRPSKIFFLACTAFRGEYNDDVIKKWLTTFCRRFFQQQFKRSCLPDGPKVGSVGLSPRGDWRMPSDACATLWLKECEEL